MPQNSNTQPPTKAPSCTKPRRRLRSKTSRPKKRRRVTKRKFWNASGTVPKDVYQRVTDRILADLQKGVTPWIKPWNAGNTEGRIMRPLRHNGERYKGINVLLLYSSAMEQGFTQPKWMTYRQAQEHNANVRKGEHGSLVVYAKIYQKTEQNDQGEDVARDVPFLKAYNVFNVEQIDGLPEQFYDKPPPKFNSAVERIAHAEEFFANTGAKVINSTRAMYSGATDHIAMPPIETFIDSERYYSTMAHETVHWTKGPGRLERDFGRKKFGDAGYALEEIVAEMGAAFVCEHLEISPTLPDDHAAYIASWMLALQDDKHAIFRAASFAQKAVDYLASLQPGYRPDPEPEIEAIPETEPGPSSQEP